MPLFLNGQFIIHIFTAFSFLWCYFPVCRTLTYFETYLVKDEPSRDENPGDI